MGYLLRRWLADRLPADVPSGERVVALEIADQANDTTRKAYGPELLALLVRRCGFTNAKQIGKVLAKLGARGIELREPARGPDGTIRTDSAGRPMYAFKGHEVTYRIPDERECPALMVPPAGDLSCPPAQETNTPQWSPAGSQRSPHRGQRSPARGSMLPPQGAPSPQSPHLSSTPLSQSARDRQGARHLRQTYRLTDLEVAMVIRELDRRAPRPIENLAGYMVSMKEGELADIVDAVMDQAPPQVDQILDELAEQDHARAEPEPAPSPPSWPLPAAAAADGLRPTQAWTDAKDLAHAGVCKTARCPRCEAYRKRTIHAA